MNGTTAVPRLTLGLPTYNGERVAQVKAARSEGLALSDKIMRGTSVYVGEVESLLEQVAGDALGLAAPRRREPERHEEVAWHGN